jgi:hypothetical protein
LNFALIGSQLPIFCFTMHQPAINEPALAPM